MPYICTKTSTAITDSQERTMKAKLGEAITLLGKGENWLMLEFEDNCRFWFAGEKVPAAYVEVKLLGKATAAAYEKMTAAVTGIISEETGIEGQHIYVKYEEVEHWGWNSSNF